MSAITKKQVDVIDALQNGGFIWRAGGIVFLARQTAHGFASERLNARTFSAIEPLLKQEDGRDRWVIA